MIAQLPALQVVVPLIGAVICAVLPGERPAWTVTALVSLVLAGIAGLLLALTLAHGPLSYALGGWPPPIGIEYRADALSATMLALISVIGLVITPFARISVKKDIAPQNRSRFYSLYLLCMTGLLGMVITGDAFNAFVFLEISSLATYGLIALGRDRRALLAAFRYLAIGTTGATMYVIGVALLYTLTGTLNLADMAAILAGRDLSSAALAGMGFIVTGLVLKLALFPVHWWLPDAYAFSPSFAGVFLAATATKVAFYLLMRFIFTVFGLHERPEALPWPEIFIVLSVLAMTIAALTACFQTNLKRMLAFSSLSQLGYITLGLALVSESGLAASVIHVINHAVIKGTLFLIAGLAALRYGGVTLAGLAGLGKRDPLLMAAFTIAALALIGVPGTAGFISKWFLLAAIFEKGWWWLAGIVVVSSVIAVAYMGRALEQIWLRSSDGGPAPASPSPLPLSALAPVAVLTLACLWLGFDTRANAGLAAIIAQQMLGLSP